MEKNLYFIHGNGQNSSCSPRGFACDNLPGHGINNWNTHQYNIQFMIEKYVDCIPRNATVFAHSLGGHIAINAALKRSDITIFCFGMVPLQQPADIGSLMLVNKEFLNFQKPNRSDDEIKDFLAFSKSDNDQHNKLLYDAALEQDPNFNSIFFTIGLNGYDWLEVDKAKSLKNRFNLVLTKHEIFYDYEKAKDLQVPIVFDPYQGHSPWLVDSKWPDHLL